MWFQSDRHPPVTERLIFLWPSPWGAWAQGLRGKVRDGQDGSDGHAFPFTGQRDGRDGRGALAAESCPNPDALGTSRTVTVDPKAMPLLGTLQYKQTIPLQKGEVILTFDDGPLPPYTTGCWTR